MAATDHVPAVAAGAELLTPPALATCKGTHARRHAAKTGSFEQAAHLALRIHTDERAPGSALDVRGEHRSDAARVQQFAADDAVVEDLARPEVPGVAVVDENRRESVRSKDATDLAKRPGHVGRVVQDAVGGHAVEARVGERELLGVAFHDRGLQAKFCQVLPGKLNVSGRQVNAGRASTSARVLAEVDPLAATHVKNIQPMGALVVERVRHPWRVLTPTAQKRLDARLFGAARGLRPLLNGPLFPINHAQSVGGIA